MRDQSRIIANTLLTYGARAVAGVVGLLLVRFMLLRLGDESYGLIGIATSILQFVVLIEVGIRPAAARQFTRFLADGEVDRANRLASSAMAVYAAMALAILAVVALFAPAFLRSMHVPPHLLGEGRLVLQIVALSVGATLLWAPYEAALASQLRYDVQQYAEIGGWLLRAALIVGGFSLLAPRVWIWAAAALAAALMALGVQRRQARRHCPSLRLERRLVSRGGLRDLAGVGLYTSVLRLAGWLANTSGALIVSFFLGTAAVAHYTPAIALVFAIQPLTRGFLTQLVPVVTRAVANGDRGLVQRVLVRSTRYSLLASGAAMVLIATVAPALVRVWLGPGYADTARVLELWCGVGLLQACVGAAFPVFLGTGRLRAMAAVNALLAAVSFAASAWLVGWAGAGIAGPALAALATQGVRTLAYLKQSTRICELGRTRYLRTSFAGPAVSLAVLGAASLGLQQVLPVDHLAGLAGVAVGSGALFAPVAWLVGLTADDRRLALETLRAGVARMRRSPPDRTPGDARD